MYCSSNDQVKSSMLLGQRRRRPVCRMLKVDTLGQDVKITASRWAQLTLLPYYIDIIIQGVPPRSAFCHDHHVRIRWAGWRERCWTMETRLQLRLGELDWALQIFPYHVPSLVARCVKQHAQRIHIGCVVGKTGSVHAQCHVISKITFWNPVHFRKWLASLSQTDRASAFVYVKGKSKRNGNTKCFAARAPGSVVDP